MIEKSAIFFDFDETLVHADPPVFDTFLNACSQIDLEFTEGQSKRGQRFLYHYFAGSQAQGDYAHFGQDLDQFYLNVTTRLLVEMGMDGDAANYAIRVGELSVRLPKGLRCDSASYHILETLQAQGMTLGVISNNGDNISARCRAFGFDEFLDFVITRNDAGCTKPDPRIFEMALDRANVPAERTIYVGDNYFADALGAKDVGIKPILLDPDSLFPEADCIVIGHLGQLLDAI